MKKIAILGSTGSIGTQTLDIVRNQGDMEIAALSAGKNIKLLEKQIREFLPRIVSVWEYKDACLLRENIKDLSVKVVFGMEGLIEIARFHGYEILVTAIVGMIGIKPTIEAIHAGKTIALANKETLVCAGHLIMPLAKEKNVSILPVDSEHSAIFQCINGEERNKINKILLTASGGPFLGKKREELGKVRVEDALNHPNWSMGKKITIDSATMVNKGLEVMEAKWLFGVSLEQIQVVVHPQSIIHSMVEYEDGGIMAQLGMPDMHLPIQYALYYPERKKLAGQKLDFYQLSKMTFEKPDMDAFRGLALAYESMKKGGNAPTIYNAANEKAVALFLDGQIQFLEITEIIEESLKHCRFMEAPSVEEILQTEKETYTFIESRW